MNDKVCIVTPFHKSDLSDNEKLSLKTIQKHFKNEKKFLVTFHENKIDFPNFERVNFNKNFFENIQGYNNLCTSTEFYRSFLDFEYMLICQLDVIVLCLERLVILVPQQEKRVHLTEVERNYGEGDIFAMVVLV